MNNCHRMYSEPPEYDHNYIYYDCFYENDIFKYIENKNIHRAQNITPFSNDKPMPFRDDRVRLRVHKCYPKASHPFILYVQYSMC